MNTQHRDPRAFSAAPPAAATIDPTERAQHERELKRFAGLQAAAALHGFVVERIVAADESEAARYAITRWTLQTTVATLDELAAWLHRAGVAL